MILSKIDATVLTALIGLPAAFMTALGTIWFVNRPPHDRTYVLQDYATRHDVDELRTYVQDEMADLRAFVSESQNEVRRDMRAQVDLLARLIKGGRQ